MGRASLVISPVQFAVASNQGRSEGTNGSSLVNLFAETLPPDSKTPAVLYGTPGQVLFSSLPTGPVQGMIIMDDLLYVVTGSAFYRVEWNGTYTNLGAVHCSGRVSITTNGIYVVFVDGYKGYAYSVAGGLVELQGEGWYPANTATHQDAYFIFNRASTGQFFFSGLLDITLDPLDYATAEAAPDDTIAIISDQRALWLFGQTSIEVWFNDGSTPWVRMQGAYIERGIAAPHSAVKMDNGIFFLGDNGVVYRTNGYSIARVSTHAIEFEFLSGKISDAYAYSYTEEGHAFYVLTIPAINRTAVYDSASGLWHERSHSAHGRHNGSCYARIFNKHLIGDFQSGNIYSLEMGAYTDDGDKIERIGISPAIYAKQNRATMNSFEVVVNSGSGTSFGNGFDPEITLQFSDDGKKSWSNRKVRKIGKIGKYKNKARWIALGQFMQRHIKLTTTAPVPIIISGTYADIQVDN